MYDPPPEASKNEIDTINPKRFMLLLFLDSKFLMIKYVNKTIYGRKIILEVRVFKCESNSNIAIIAAEIPAMYAELLFKFFVNSYTSKKIPKAPIQ